MNRRQESILRMFHGVESLLDGTPAVWQNVQPVATQVAQFKNTLSNIKSIVPAQADPVSQGITADKNDQLTKLNTLGYSIAVKVRGYAKLSNNLRLLSQVDYSPSEFSKGSLNSQLVRNENILAAAKENLANLGEHKVTQELVDTFEAALRKLEPVAGQRDAVKSESIKATSSITEELNKGRAQLDILDDLVEGLIEDENFVAQYFQLRQIIDARSTAKKEV